MNAFGLNGPARQCSSRRPAHRGVAGLMLIWASCCGLLSQADQPVAEPIEYRRIHVPAAAPGLWPRDGDEQYFPIDADQLDHLLRQANQPNQGDLRTTPRVTRADYTARYEEGRLVDGQATLTVQHTDQQPGFLSWDSVSVALAEPRWLDPVERPAELGTWGRRGDVLTRFGLAVPAAGKLAFNWHASADDTQAPATLFQLQLPPAVAGQFVLEVPVNLRLDVQGGVVLGSELGDRARSSQRSERSVRNRADSAVDPRRSQPSTADRVTATGQPLRRWKIALPGHGRLTLRIENLTPGTAEQPPTNAVAEQVSYAITERGLDVAALLTLHQADQPLTELTLIHDRSVQITSVTENDMLLESRVTAPDSLQQVRTIVTLPAGRGETSRAIKIAAWGTLLLEERWSLPTFRVPGARWTAGQFVLTVTDSLELVDLIPTGCVQTDAPVAQLTTGRPINFDQFVAGSTLSVHVARREPEALGRVVTTLSLDESEIIARQQAELSVSRGDSHVLMAEILSGWAIDEVSTRPADAIREWHVEQSGPRRLAHFHLTESLRQLEPLTILVTGRAALTEATDPIGLHRGLMLEWRDVRWSEKRLHIPASDSFSARPVDGATPIPPSRRLPADQPLDDFLPNDMLFDLMVAPPGAAVRMEMEQAPQQFTVSVELVFEKDIVRGRYDFASSALATHVEPLLICFDSPLPKEVQWSQLQPGWQPAARRLEHHAGVSAGPVGGEVWEVRHHGQAGQQITAEFTLSTRGADWQRIPLAAVLGNVQQQGRVELIAAPGRDVAVDSQGLEPSVPTAGPPTGPQHRVARYHYLPADVRDGESRVVLAVQLPTESSVDRGLPITWAEISSRYSPAGRATHELMLQDVSASQQNVRLSLPIETLPDSIQVDEGRTPYRVLQPDSELSIDFELTDGPRDVTLRFTTLGPRLTAEPTLQPPLPRAGLSVLAGRWTIWLPSRYQASGTNLLQRGRRRSWQERLFGVLARRHSRRPFDPVAIEDWLTAPGRVANTRPAATPRGSGWQDHLVLLGGAGTTRIDVHRPARRDGLNLALLIVGGVVGSLVRLRPLAAWVVAAGMLAIFGALATAAAADWAAGLLLGLLLGGALRTASTRLTDFPAAFAGRFSTTAVRSLALLAGAGWVADGIELRAETPTAIQRIYVPTDNEGQPVGTTRFVERGLLERLTRRSLLTENRTGDWLIRGATYEGQLITSAERAAVVPGNWVADLDLLTRARNTRVHLPLRREDAAWGKSASLDGLPVALDWIDDQTCALAVNEPGTYRLRIPLVPRVRVDERVAAIELGIPRSPDSQLLLTFPPELEGVSVANREIEFATATSGAPLRASLGNRQRLQLAWPSPTLGTRSDGWRTNELLWLRVSPDGLRLSVTLEFQGTGLPLEQFRLETGRQLELVSSSVPTNLMAADESDQLQSFLTQLPAPLSDGLRVTLEFAWTGLPRDGQFELPHLEVTDVERGSRRWGLSAGGPLECDLVGNDAKSTSSIEDFMTSWGNDSDWPQVVCEVPEDPRALYLAVGPRTADPTTNDALTIVAGRERLDLLYQADILTGGLPQFRQAIQVSPQVQIDEIAVTQSLRQIPRRWSRPQPDRIVVFFAVPIDEYFRLSVKGSQPLPAEREIAVPRFAAVGQSPASRQLTIRRYDDTLVSLESDAQLDESTSLPVPSKEPGTRTVGTYLINEQIAAASRLIVEPNLVDAVADTMVTVARDEETWRATWTCQVRVERGLLDKLELTAPKTWSGPFTAEPALAVDTIAEAVPGVLPDGTETQRVRIRLAEPRPAGKPLMLEVSSPLQVAAGALVEVPRIRLNGVFETARYLATPLEVDGQPATWTQVGMKSELQAPAQLSPPRFSPQPNRIFRIEEDSYRCWLLPQVTATPQASIPLADVHVFYQHGWQLMLTRLVVRPSRLQNYELAVPPDHEMLAMRLSGVEPITQSTGPNLWKLQIGPPQLPQTLEVLTRIRREQAGDVPETLITRPQLRAENDPLPVEIGLWSLATPADSVPQALAEVTATSHADQALLQLERLVQLAEAATEAALASPSADRTAWLRCWQHELQSAQDRAQRAVRSTPQATQPGQIPSEQTPQEKLDQAIAAIDAWNQLANSAVSIAPDDSPGRAPLDTWWDALRPDTATRCFVSQGSNDQLRATATPTNGVGFGPSLRTTAGLAVTTLLALTVLLRPAVRDLICRWPHVLGIVVGLVWWSWLTPSFLGLAIVAASLWLLHRARQAPYYPTGAPTPAHLEQEDLLVLQT